jgi:hypothetical protein
MIHTRLHLAILLGLFFAPMVGPARAEEQTSKYGIVGLFSPDRQEDLREVMRVLPDFKLTGLDPDNAVATVRYDIARLFPNANPRKPPTEDEILQRLNNLLSPASQGTFRLRPLSNLPKEKLTKVEIHIGVLDCKACRYGAYLAVLRVEGVERATVIAKPSLVTAWIDGSRTDRAALEAALERAGVPVNSKP